MGNGENIFIGRRVRDEGGIRIGKFLQSEEEFENKLRLKLKLPAGRESNPSKPASTASFITFFLSLRE
jgi:hypothetical protein